MWTNGLGTYYDGDCKIGDRAATPEEEAAHGLAVLRSATLTAAGAIFRDKTVTGVTHTGNAYQLDDASLTRITALATRAGLAVLGVPGVTWPADFVFIAADNSQVAFTAAQFLAFATAAADKVIALRMTFRALKDQILAAEDAADLEAIDITAGWN